MEINGQQRLIEGTCCDTGSEAAEKLSLQHAVSSNDLARSSLLFSSLLVSSRLEGVAYSSPTDVII